MLITCWTATLNEETGFHNNSLFEISGTYVTLSTWMKYSFIDKYAYKTYIIFTMYIQVHIQITKTLYAYMVLNVHSTFHLCYNFSNGLFFMCPLKLKCELKFL